MKRICLIQKEQFGLVTDTVKWCEHLSDRYLFDVLSFDYGKAKPRPMNNVSVRYIHHFKSRAVNAVLLLLSSTLKILSGRYDFIILEYFPHCSLLKKIFQRQKIHVDVRTASIDRDEACRKCENSLMSADITVFNSASYITEGVRQTLQVNSGQKTFLLPLGADIISPADKSFDRLDILYVGTLFNRNILQTVEGVNMFRKRHPEVPLHYDIIGGGDKEESSKIEAFIGANALEDVVSLHGLVPYEELKPFFDTHNIGLSYVPEYDFYQHQPPTKTFEYILSGLFCLATGTLSNREVIDSANGIIHSDNPGDLSRAIESVWDRRAALDSCAIRSSLKSWQWKNIVDTYLVPIIEQ